MSRTVKVNTYHRGFGWTLILSFTIISMMLNGVHAVLTMRADGDGWAAFAIALMAVMAPLSMLLTTHLLVGLIQDWSHRRTWLVRLRGVVAAVSAAIALVSFVLSFAALRDMAVLYGEMSTSLAWLVPLIIDAVILAATLAVVVAEAEMRLDREEMARAAELAEASVTTDSGVTVAAVRMSAGPSMTPGHDRADSTGGHPVVGVRRTVTDTADDTVVDTLDTAADTPAAVVQDTVIPLSRPADQRVDSPSVSVQGSADTADTGVLDTADDIFDDDVQDEADTFDSAVQDIVSGGVKAANDTAVDTGETVADTATAGVQDTADDTFDGGARDDADTSADTLDLASVTARVIAEVGTTADTAVVERVLELALDGMSARRISDALAPEGPSRTPIAAWVRAAKEQPVYSAALAGRRQLVAVD
ncbi:Protein of unknown function [Gordonia malaquae]|uniref:DUF2637 domain-containing protein n=1 Tax=Gordonia malaquae NBRC 108250 TaxID=1223542 RepID=M3TBM9_GORML|nr:DUF2637 domain-containing protein [Gordonia malaquae]GAC78771.1 hypothetical protein GM1_004_02160 [Gordonia malaquae NBRC 108250]SED65251.1 Protein of unknown function [Gordonia malaquae]